MIYLHSYLQCRQSCHKHMDAVSKLQVWSETTIYVGQCELILSGPPEFKTFVQFVKK